MSTETTAARGTTAAESTRVPAPAIRAFIHDALVAVQIPPDDAARVAELMTEADLTGADAHGVFRLPQYVKRVTAGGLNRRPGMIGLYSAVASANHMAVWGGAETLLGTNPLAIGLPAGDGPIVFDMATTVVSYGTVKNYALQGRTMPEGWFINRHDGTPLTDPRRSADGLLLPIGGYKGSGLALMLGLLAGTLNGAAFGREVVDFNADASTETNTGHFIAAIDIARFVPLATFTAEADRHLDDLRASPRLPGFDAIRLPGDRRAECRAERTRDGVPLAPALLDQLDRLAQELRLEPLRRRM